MDKITTSKSLKIFAKNNMLLFIAVLVNIVMLASGSQKSQKIGPFKHKTIEEFRKEQGYVPQSHVRVYKDKDTGGYTFSHRNDPIPPPRIYKDNNPGGYEYHNQPGRNFPTNQNWQNTGNFHNPDLQRSPFPSVPQTMAPPSVPVNGLAPQYTPGNGMPPPPIPGVGVSGPRNPNMAPPPIPGVGSKPVLKSPTFDNGNKRSSSSSKSQNKKFGCNFDSQYNEILLYGPQNFINVLQFQTMDEFNVAITALEKLYSDFISEEVFNDVDMSFDLYNSCNGRSFMQCYQSFVPNFNNAHESGRLAVDLLNQLIQRGREFKHFKVLRDIDWSNYVYLVAANWKAMVQDGQYPQNPHHVAAFIKFQVGNMSGYIVLDPGFAADKPLVVMEDSRKNTNIFRRNKAFTTAWTHEGNSMECNFIHSYHAIDCVVQLESNPMHQASFPHMLYYIAKPYCSFVQNTLKPSLLSPKRMIVRRDFEGNILASLSAVFIPGISTIDLAYYERTKKKFEITVLKIPVHIATKCLDKREYQDFIRKVSAQLKMTETKLKNTIRILSNILLNRIYLTGIDSVRHFRPQHSMTSYSTYNNLGDLWESPAMTSKVSQGKSLLKTNLKRSVTVNQCNA